MNKKWVLLTVVVAMIAAIVWIGWVAFPAHADLPPCTYPNGLYPDGTPEGIWCYEEYGNGKRYALDRTMTGHG